MDQGLFSPALLKYVEEHLITQDSPLQRFRLHSVIWIPSDVFDCIPGNHLREDKLTRVKEWLVPSEGPHRALDIIDEYGLSIGLPLISIDCRTGAFKLEEGNHRVHVMRFEKKAEKIPVEIMIRESIPPDFYDEIDEDEVSNLHIKLLTLLFANGYNHSGLWSNKEVWRATVYTVVQELILSYINSSNCSKKPKIENLKK